MKLVIATGTSAPDTSGPATYVAELAPALQQRGYNVSVVTYGDGPTDYPYPVHRVSRRHSLLVRYWLYMVAVYQQAAQSDLVYIQGPVSEGLPGMLGAMLAGKKFCLKVVGDYAWEQAAVQTGDKRTIGEFQTTPRQDRGRIKLWRRIERWVAKRAQLVITPSKYLEGIVAGWGVEQARRRVILNAFKRQTVPAESQEQLRQRLGLNTPTIVSIGRLVPWKHFDQLIAALPSIREQVSGTQLVIIGDGPELGRLRAAAAAGGVADAVTFTGQLPFDHVFTYMAAADCLVLNSSYEGLSHVLLEAMSAGVPIVATDVCGNGEVIRHRQNGLLVPFGDQTALITAIVELLQNHEFAQRLVANYAQALQQFEPERLVEQTATALESCV
jgi:glycosyltransferase involved in cell wall biosynthesis